MGLQGVLAARGYAMIRSITSLTVPCAALVLVSVPHVASQARTVIVDFEYGSHGDALPEVEYLDQDVRIVGVTIFERRRKKR
jgi:hypothetical protein